MKKHSPIKKYWIETYGEKGLEPVKKLDFYKPKYQKVMTELYNTIKLYEIDYEGWGRKIFCRELAEEIINVVEKYYVLKKDKNS